MRRCDSKVSRVSRGYKGSKDSRESRWSRDSRDSRVSRDSKESRMSRRPSAFRSVPRQLLVLQAALFGYRELQQRNRRISVSIRKWFPFRVEWLLTTCRWIDSKKIRSLRVREMICTFVRNLKMQEIPRLKILANEINFHWTQLSRMFRSILSCRKLIIKLNIIEICVAWKVILLKRFFEIWKYWKLNIIKTFVV